MGRNSCAPSVFHVGSPCGESIFESLEALTLASNTRGIYRTRLNHPGSVAFARGVGEDGLIFGTDPWSSEASEPAAITQETRQGDGRASSPEPTLKIRPWSLSCHDREGQEKESAKDTDRGGSEEVRPNSNHIL